MAVKKYSNNFINALASTSEVASYPCFCIALIVEEFGINQDIT